MATSTPTNFYSKVMQAGAIALTYLKEMSAIEAALSLPSAMTTVGVPVKTGKGSQERLVARLFNIESFPVPAETRIVLCAKSGDYILSPAFKKELFVLATLSGTGLSVGRLYISNPWKWRLSDPSDIHRKAEVQAKPLAIITPPDFVLPSRG